MEGTDDLGPNALVSGGAGTSRSLSKRLKNHLPYALLKQPAVRLNPSLCEDGHRAHVTYEVD